jgi:hypothetical protein
MRLAAVCLGVAIKNLDLRLAGVLAAGERGWRLSASEKAEKGRKINWKVL